MHSFAEYIAERGEIKSIVNESSDINSLKKIHNDVLKFLKSKKADGKVSDLAEFPNKYGDHVSTFSVKYNIEDRFNYKTQDIKIDHSRSVVFMPNKGYFPFETFNDIKRIINKKSSLKESVVNEGILPKSKNTSMNSNRAFAKSISDFIAERRELESINEGKYDVMLDKLASIVKGVNFMDVGKELKKNGIKYSFSTSMIPMYKIDKLPIAIVNKDMAAGAEREVGDIAIGLLESLNEGLLNESSVEIEGEIKKDKRQIVKIEQ